MPIHPGIVPAVHIYAIGNRLVARTIEGVSREDLLRAPEAMNPLLWMWGHLTNTRCGLAMMLGVERERLDNDLFGRGSELVVDSDYPAESAIQACWDEVTAQLAERFESLTEEELSQPAPRDFPIDDKTIGGAVTFMAYHESYHCGQMALLKKWLGLGQLVG